MREEQAADGHLQIAGGDGAAVAGVQPLAHVQIMGSVVARICDPSCRSRKRVSLSSGTLARFPPVSTAGAGGAMG